MNRARAPEAETEGVPMLELRDEDREAVADELAEMLVAALARESRTAEPTRPLAVVKTEAAR